MKTTYRIVPALLGCIIAVSCATTYYSPQSWFEVDKAKYQKEQDWALFDAVKNFDVSGVERALDNKANPDVADRLGQSALMWACWNEQPEIVNALITYKNKPRKPRPHINNGSSKNYTALLCTAIQGNRDIFIMLMDAYKDDNAVKAKDDTGEGVLHKAAKSGNPEFVNYIIGTYINGKRILSINEKDKNGYTPLHLAVLAGDESIVDILLDNKADPMLYAEFAEQGKPKQRIYPVFSAYTLRNYAVYVSLLKHIEGTKGRTIKAVLEDITDDDGKRLTSLIQKIKNESVSEELKYYIGSLERKYNGSPNDQIEEPEFADAKEIFYAAVKNENTSISEVQEKGDRILRYIDKYGPRGPTGDLLLIQAVENNSIPTVEYLLKNGFKTTPQNNLLVTTTRLAKSKTEYHKLLTFLLDNIERYPAIKQLNGKDTDGNTALRYLVQNTAYLNTLEWAYIQRIFDLYHGQALLPIKNSIQEWVVVDIIKSGMETPDKISRYRNRMFEYLYKLYIQYNPDYRANREDFVIHYAFNQGYYEGVEYLIKAGGINLEIPDDIDNKTLENMIAERIVGGGNQPVLIKLQGLLKDSIQRQNARK
ncbi:hypothetical protein AGMMS50268_05550 [Spirochaetia bacterium]|nr:hypothetical protein AGMMS50268_05550 [Spirochaetia bacterium]